MVNGAGVLGPGGHYLGGGGGLDQAAVGDEYVLGVVLESAGHVLAGDVAGSGACGLQGEHERGQVYSGLRVRGVA
ncbi:hypothetical protein ACQB60_45575 [Actinomycetota bacterium Odt1-20B]